MSILSESTLILTQAFSPATAIPVALAFFAWMTLIILVRVLVQTPLNLILNVMRAVVGLVFWHQLLQLVSNSVTTSRAWPVWLLAGSAAIASELILLTYDPPSRTENRWIQSWLQSSLVGLRLLLIGLVTILLMEPALSREEEKNEERTVAVMIDASTSMSLPTRSESNPKQPRSELAGQLFSGEEDSQSGLGSQILEGYELKLYEFASTARELPVSQANAGKGKAGQNQGTAPNSGNSSSNLNEEASRWAQHTDLAAALRKVSEDTPSEKLSGVILLTDGLDHSRTDVPQAAKHFARHNVPVNSVIIGSQQPVRDAVFVTVDAPPQIYHGDSVSVRATVRADQLKGKSTTVRFFEGATLLEKRDVTFTTDKHRESVLFRHEPADARIHRYRVELSPIDGEETVENNSAERSVWVSNDQIRVLLIEDRPRWEFRYLRNLFAGRDKTVFLQAVLLRPDRLAGVPATPVIRASAGRAFDDCEATALPASEAEWLKFDAIILGDVEPEQLGEDGIRSIEKFVRQKGGSLVVVAGRNAMPHAYRNSLLADLLPVKLTGPSFQTAMSPEAGCFLSTTKEGLSHVILQQADGHHASALEELPQLSWRHPDCQARVGATVLAYASDRRTSDGQQDAAAIPNAAPPAASDRIDLPEDEQRKRALMLWHRFGAGKVLQMNFDESWRLRYGIGDRLHHQFWGQIIRWSVSERLSSGTDLVRMGTDRTLYPAGDPIVVQARLLDEHRNAIMDRPVKAVVKQGDETIRSVELVPHADRPGLLQAEIRDITTAGTYRIELQGDIVTQLLLADSQKGENVGLEIGVQSVTPGDELLDLVADPSTGMQLADLTGGIVVTPEQATSVLDHLGPKSSFQRKRWTVPLWNIWPVIGVFLGGVSLEWILRRLTGRL